jgi:hypothetical protein
MKIVCIAALVNLVVLSARAAEMKQAPMIGDNALRNGFVTVRPDPYAKMDLPVTDDPPEHAFAAE